MNHKVLLADDSLTIQKVIKITLANQPYDITDCANEDDLFHQLSIVQPKLVFLDFNLSEKFTGYELTAKIKSVLPSAKVLLLLGTFDTVDDAAMEKCGASDKIVKPFDSNKFIAICKQLIETFANDDIPYPEKKVEVQPLIQDSPEDQWTVSHSTEQKLPVEEKKPEPILPTMQNPLAKEMSDWGMSIPNVINDTEAHDKVNDLPPVIGEVKSLNEHRTKNAEPAPDYSAKFPQSEDLDYPDMSDFSAANAVEEKPAPEPKSKLVSLDSLNSKPFEMEIEGSYVPDDSDVSSIEAQIRDEVEENLWQADEFEDLKKEVAQKIEEVKTNFQPTRNDFDESLFKPLDEKETIDWANSNELFKSETFSAAPTGASQVNMTEVKQEMEAMVRQYVKEYVKQYMDEMFKKNTEKVAWEVIPDLAENLIRQELSKISNKIINE